MFYPVLRIQICIFDVCIKIYIAVSCFKLPKNAKDKVLQWSLFYKNNTFEQLADALLQTARLQPFVRYGGAFIPFNPPPPFEPTLRPLTFQ